jgi:DnaJ like chaperone protein
LLVDICFVQAVKSMRFIGKLIGALVGLRFGFFGVLFGAVIGHLFDRGIVRAKVTLGSNVMSKTLFTLMGFVAKADGHVSEREIAVSEQLLDQFGFDGTQRDQAIAQFNAGRSPHYNPSALLQEFVAQFSVRSSQAEQMLSALIAIAYADGSIDETERQALKQIAVELGFREDEFVRELERFRPSEAKTSDESLDSAYQTLGLEPGANAYEIKLAYRKLISQYHPDKLEGAGVRGDALKGAQAKAKEVRGAYERLSHIK